MLRLVLVLVGACILGAAGGIAQYAVNYRDTDERLASFRAVSSPTIAIEDSVPEVTETSDLGEPRVEVVGGTSFDFGSMQQGSSKAHSFIFRNIGKGPLKLEVVGSSCRCTIGKLDNPSLAPGEETAVTLEWKATGVLNEFSQTATIKTSDPEHPQVVLSVRGVVARTVLTEPADLNLGDIPVTGELKRTAYVFGFGDQPLEITQATWADQRTADLVKISVTPIAVDKLRFPEHAKANGAAQIDVTIPEGMPMGPFESRILLTTNVKNVADVELNVTGNVVGDIQLIAGPSYDAKNKILNLGKVDRQSGAETRLHLSVQGPMQDSLELELGEVVPQDSMIVTIGEPKQQTNRTLYPITCSIPKGAPPAMFPGTNPNNFGKFVIKTNHPNIPEVRVNVRVIIE